MLASGHSERMIRAVLRAVVVQMAVLQLDAAVGLARDVGVVRDHQDRVAGVVQLAENFHDDGFVGFVEIAGGLVGEDELWLIDQGAGDGYALLFAAGELRGEMREAVAEADAAQGFVGLRFVGDAVEVLREHHVFDGGEIRDEMKLLEDEADFFGAVADQSDVSESLARSMPSTMTRPEVSVSRPPRTLMSVVLPEPDGPISATHSPGFDAESEGIDGAEGAVLLGKRFDGDLRASLRAFIRLERQTAGRMLARRRSGYAPAIATRIVSSHGYRIHNQAGLRRYAEDGFAESDGEQRCLRLRLATPPTRPSNAASARKRRRTRRVAPPMAFMRPTSFLRSMATLVMAAITQSVVRIRTTTTVAVSRPLMRL